MVEDAGRLSEEQLYSVTNLNFADKKYNRNLKKLTVLTLKSQRTHTSGILIIPLTAGYINIIIINTISLCSLVIRRLQYPDNSCFKGSGLPKPSLPFLSISFIKSFCTIHCTIMPLFF